jgi:cyclic pyranopterin phosphate synthase
MSPSDDDPQLSHVTRGPGGAEARMVDVGGKPTTDREALAEAVIRFPAGLLERVLRGDGPKGPVLEVARVGLDLVEVRFEPVAGDPDRLRVLCRARCSGRTGVEMEAMTGASLAALCVYDMTKAASKGIEVERLRLLRKSGGKSGEWAADGDL